ncbi:MAG: T9SS type A sorting domain-containing protein [Ignavibacteriaceae bacterium]
MKSKIQFSVFLLISLCLSVITIAQSVTNGLFEGSEYFNVGMFSVVGGTVSAPQPGTQEFRDELQQLWQGSTNEYNAINTVHSYRHYIGNSSFLNDYLSDINIVSDSLKTLADCRFVRIDLDDDGILSQEEINTFLTFFDIVLNDPNADHIAGWYIADEPTSNNIEPVELEKIYDVIKLRDNRPIYIAEAPSTADFSRFLCDILIIDYYYYSINSYTDLATLSYWKELIIGAREDLKNAGREDTEVHALLVAGEEIFPDDLNENLMASHGLTHSAIRRVLDLGVDGIWFYAWRAGVINNEDAVHRWLTQQEYAEAIETEIHDREFLVTLFNHQEDNQLVISDIGNNNPPDEGTIISYINDINMITTGDLQGSNEIQGEPIFFDESYRIENGYRSNSDGDDELITVFNNGDIFYSEDGNKPDDILIDSFQENITAVTSGDFDGDGDDELVTATQDGNQFNVFVSDDGKAGNIKQYQIYFSEEFKVTALTSGDFNGDGRDELVTAISNSQLVNSYIYIDDISSTGNCCNGTPWFGPDNIFHVTALASRDFNNDKIFKDRLIIALSNSELKDTRIYSTSLIDFIFDSANVFFGPDDYWHVTSMTFGDFIDDERTREELILALSNTSFDHTIMYKTSDLLLNGLGDIIYDPGFPSYYYVSTISSGSFRESLHPVVSDVEDVPNKDKLIIQNYTLSQNYPNPFNPSTIIKFTIPIGVSSFNSLTTLKVYDILGKQVTTLVNDELPEGEYEVTFDASSLSSGIYFYQMITGSNVLTKQMVLLK